MGPMFTCMDMIFLANLLITRSARAIIPSSAAGLCFTDPLELSLVLSLLWPENIPFPVSKKKGTFCPWKEGRLDRAVAPLCHSRVQKKSLRHSSRGRALWCALKVSLDPSFNLGMTPPNSDGRIAQRALTVTEPKCQPGWSVTAAGPLCPAGLRRVKCGRLAYAGRSKVADIIHPLARLPQSFCRLVF